MAYDTHEAKQILDFVTCTRIVVYGRSNDALKYRQMSIVYAANEELESIQTHLYTYKSQNYLDLMSIYTLTKNNGATAALEGRKDCP
jgi:hypothetical protein